MPALNSVKKQFSGPHYFLMGTQLIFTPGIKRYVFIPLLLNIVLMGGALTLLFQKLGDWINRLMASIPDMFQWLSYLIWPLAVVLILFVFGYFFSTLANLIAAPFNGLLAEQVEAHLTGQKAPDTSLWSLIQDLPRILMREVSKLLYALPRFLLLFLLSFIPGVGQLLVPILLFLFGAWMLSLQYCDYPFDNHKVPFSTMRKSLHQHRFQHLQFGALISLFTLIPLLNLFIMPVAVCGATAMWVTLYRQR